MGIPRRIVRGTGGSNDPYSIPPLGQILLEHDWIEQGALDGALVAQGRSTGRRLGEVVVALGAASEHHVGTALAEQWGLGFVDLDAQPVEPGLVSDPADADACLEHRILPWRRLGLLTTYVTDRPEGAAAALGALREPVPMAFFAVAGRRQMDQALSQAFGPVLAERAARRVPDGQSVRTLGAGRATVAGLGISLALVLAVGGAPLAGVAWLLVLGIHLATLGLRTLALIAGARAPEEDDRSVPDMVRLADHRPRPMVSILVALYREAGMIDGLIVALEALDYPRELLDIKLLVENDDHATRAALAARDLPGWISVLVVPEGQPRTKPRALNHALGFCTGEVIGVLDAEDRPDPAQIERVVARLAEAPRETVAVQCQLAYYNAAENWLSRCFQLEYAIWFEVLLRGYQRLGLPLPLGGTSVYFRARALHDLDGWDAHNVTEDADLGLRLARHGWRCEVVRSTTGEEAACHLVQWIRQRSRWTKGYALTWMSHMRDPVALWRDLGPKGFIATQVIFLGGIATYLAMPLFWLSLAAWAFSGDGLWHRAVPEVLVAPVGASLVIGWVVMLAAAIIAMVRRGQPRLLAWAPTLPIYWWLGAIAAWKAAGEVLLAPYYWDKTPHGVSLMTAAAPVKPPQPETPARY